MCTMILVARMVYPIPYTAYTVVGRYILLYCVGEGHSMRLKSRSETLREQEITTLRIILYKPSNIADERVNFFLSTYAFFMWKKTISYLYNIHNIILYLYIESNGIYMCVYVSFGLNCVIIYIVCLIEA